MSYVQLDEYDAACESDTGPQPARLTKDLLLDLVERHERGEAVALPGGFGGLCALASGKRSTINFTDDLEPESDDAVAAAASATGTKKAIDTVRSSAWSSCGRFLLIARERGELSSKRDEPGTKPECFVEVYAVGARHDHEHGLPSLQFQRRFAVPWTRPPVLYASPEWIVVPLTGRAARWISSASLFHEPAVACEPAARRSLAES